MAIDIDNVLQAASSAVNESTPSASSFVVGGGFGGNVGITTSAPDIARATASTMNSGSDSSADATIDSILRAVSDYFVDGQIDKVAEQKVEEVLNGFGIPMDMVKRFNISIDVASMVRGAIHGTYDTIFKNPQLKENMVQSVKNAVSGYFDQEVQALIRDLNIHKVKDDVLRPLRGEVENVFGTAGREVLDVQDKLAVAMDLAKKVCGGVDLSGELSKYTSSINASNLLASLDIDNKLGKVITDLKLDEQLNKAIAGLNLDSQLNGIVSNLDKEINGFITKEVAPAITEVTKVIQDVSKEVAKVQEAIERYENMVTDLVNSWENKAKAWLEEQTNELVSKISDELGIDLGGAIGGLL